MKYFRKPCHIEQVNYKQPVDELYANKATDKQKDIVNKTTGLAEKKYNTNHVCKVFQDYAEAQHYQLRYGGKIYSLQQCSHDPVNEDLSVEEFLLKYGNVSFEPAYGEKIHVLVIEKKKQLLNGFRYIKEMIYNHMAIKMFTLFNEVVSKGIVSMGIKTDAILVTEAKEELEKLFHFDASKKGGIKFESGKFCANKRVTQTSNSPFDIKPLKIWQPTIKNEWKYDEFQELFDFEENDGEARMNWFLGGPYPGVGKTHAVSSYKGHEILFVPPFNTLAQETKDVKGHDACTVHKLLGIFGDGQQYAKVQRTNIEKYDCICFDEVLLNPPFILQKIDLFMKSHPKIKFFTTGDTDQLQPINFNYNNVTNRGQYMLNCIAQMFPNQITLKIPKRVKTEAERQTIYQLKDDIFHSDKNIHDVLKNHNFKVISNMSDVTSTKNVCYFKYRTKQVNKYVHRNLIEHPKKFFCIDNMLYWTDL